MALPDRYRAAIAEQQQLQARIINDAGLGPTRRLYTSMLASVQSKIAASKTGTFTHVQLRAMLAQIKLGLAGVMRSMTAAMGDAAFRVGLESARATLEEIAALERDSMQGVFVPTPILEVARLHGLVADTTSSLLQHHETSLARYGTHLVGRMETELGASLATGESPYEATERIATVGDMEWWRAERIVRTELNYSASASTKAAIAEQSRDVGGTLWMRWSEHVSDDGTPLDDRVGVDSEALHGQVAPPDGDFTQPPRSPRGEEVSDSLVGESWPHPPNRPNDRAVLMPWRLGWGIPGWIWMAGRRRQVTQRIFDLYSAQAAQADDGGGDDGGGDAPPAQESETPNTPAGEGAPDGEGAAPDGPDMFPTPPPLSAPMWQPEPSPELPKAEIPQKARDIPPDAEDDTTLVAARDILQRGYFQMTDGLNASKLETARAAVDEGVKKPIQVLVDPVGRLFVDDGRHRLAASIEANKAIPVRFRRGMLVDPESNEHVTVLRPPRVRRPDADPEVTPPPLKNPRRVEAARKAGEVSAERRREIHSAARSNLAPELHAAWDKEGHKFMREEAGRIRGVKDRVNAASQISQAFAEKYGAGEASVFGNEGDRAAIRAEIDAEHAERWADEQEAKYYAAAKRSMGEELAPQEFDDEVPF